MQKFYSLDHLATGSYFKSRRRTGSPGLNKNGPKSDFIFRKSCFKLLNIKTALKHELKTEYCIDTFPVFQNIYINNI